MLYELFCCRYYYIYGVRQFLSLSEVHCLLFSISSPIRHHLTPFEGIE